MWIAGLILLLQQQVDHADSFQIDYSGKTIAIINRMDYLLPGSSLIDMDKWNHLLNTLDRQIFRAPINAKIGDHEQIIPEQNGYKLDRQLFTQQYFAYLFENGPAKIEAPQLTIHANVDNELLANIREKPIGHYITYFNSNNKNRSNNISLASKTINNHVIFPGEVFSFNQVVGKRTIEKGYLRATVIVRGELSEGIGGGICQVSSTLFNSVDRAGLKIVHRYSHSRNVTYVPAGRDATVSWDGPDFVFQNLYNQPILIRTYAGQGSVSISLYSSHMIEYKPRVVPSMVKRIPEEILNDTESNQMVHPEN